MKLKYVWWYRLKTWLYFRWHKDRLGLVLSVMQRKVTTQLIRDTQAKCEIAAMRRIIVEAKLAAQRGAVISTSRHAASIGFDKESALVVLQWFYLLSRPK